MIALNELARGDEFYFTDDKSQLFSVLKFIYKKDGTTIKTAKCYKLGKLYPVYINGNKKVIVLQNPIIKIA